MIKQEINIPIYQIDFTLVIFETAKDLEWIKDDHIFNTVIDREGAVFRYEEDLFIIFNKDCISPGLIAHESKHLVNEIFIEIHHKLSRKNDEPEAYLLGWIVEEIFKCYPKIYAK